MVVDFQASSVPDEHKEVFQRLLKKGTPSFYIESMTNSRYPLTLLNSGDNGYELRVGGQVPTGSYHIFAQVKGYPPVLVGYNFQVESPTVLPVQVGDLYEGAELRFEGQYFTKNPEIWVRYKKPGAHAYTSKQCGLIRDSFAYDDPHDTLDVDYPMDVDTGNSSLKVQLPKLSTNTPIDLHFIIKTGNGYAVSFPKIQADGEPSHNRGDLEGYASRASIPYRKVYDYLLDSMSEGDFKFLKRIAAFQLLSEGMKDMTDHIQYDLKIYKVMYWTVDTEDKPVLASGVVIIPSLPANQNASLLSYVHGTMLQKTESFSVSNSAELGFAATFAATDGRVVLGPDHLGLGAAAVSQTKLIHPYCQWKSNAKTDGDMIPAVKALLKKAEFQSEKPPVLNNNLLLTGYSEGGYLTLGLHRELEANPTKYGFAAGANPVTASVPMDGPFSLSEVMATALLTDDEYSVPYFAPYLLVTYNKVYGIFEKDSDYLVDPYDKTLPPLINGEHSSAEVNKAMPDVVKEILPEKIQVNLRARDGKLPAKLKLNDFANPSPDSESYTIKTPVLLVHGSADDLVPYQNSEKTYFYLKNKEAPVNFKPLGSTWLQWGLHWITPYHVTYAPYAVGQSWAWLKTKAPQ